MSSSSLTKKVNNPYNCSSVGNIGMANNCLGMMDQSLGSGEMETFDFYNEVFNKHDEAYSKKTGVHLPKPMYDRYDRILSERSRLRE